METWVYILIGVAVFILFLYMTASSARPVVPENSSDSSNSTLSPEDLSNASRILKRSAMVQDAIQRHTMGKVASVLSS